ncbi:MAG TPA: alpha/beta fold hydrolase [Ktedonobacterales bacterium]|nr:alpha/beta fold hydrolase [Ktedonobacterales bacterium]
MATQREGWWAMRGARMLWAPLALALVVTFVLAGCGSESGSVRVASTATPTTPQPTATATLTVPMRTVTFMTPDGLRLGGTLYGSGTVGVALSHQIDGTQNQWRGFARQLAAHGYMALAFDFRGRNTSAGPRDISKEDVDLRAAIGFLRAQGAKRIALMGASLGGAVTLRVATTESVAAVATLSAVPSISTQEVTDATILAIKAPKLFINSELDYAASSTQHMYDIASPPKQIYIYPGNAHGVGIFSEYGPDLTQRLLTFMDTYAPAHAQ